MDYHERKEVEEIVEDKFLHKLKLYSKVEGNLLKITLMLDTEVITETTTPLPGSTIGPYPVYPGYVGPYPGYPGYVGPYPGYPGYVVTCVADGISPTHVCNATAVLQTPHKE